MCVACVAIAAGILQQQILLVGAMGVAAELLQTLQATGMQFKPNQRLL
jgi:hypothetical protein